MSKSPYKTSLNLELYSQWPATFGDLFPSYRHFWPEIIRDGLSILDVGGAAGRLGHVLQEEFNRTLEYTCVDVDLDAIKAGREMFPEFRFVPGEFPADMPPSQEKWDIITVFGWFAQVVDWKSFLLECVKRSRQYVNLGINVRLSGTTVIDPDVSFVYYLNSGERVPEITHNLYELLNFCSIHEIGARKISFFGYHPRNETSAYRPLARLEQIQGNLLIELGDGPVKRTGGISNETEAVLGSAHRSTKPEFDVLIDGTPVAL
jgi:SAM-dependent methyltransferase